MEVRLVDPADENELAEWTAVLRASDEDLWPDLIGFTLPDIRAFARHRSSSKRFDLLGVWEAGSGPILGVAMMELPLRDNTRSAEVTVAVHPARRRRGVGTAIVEAMTEHGRADGRLVLNAIVDVPLDRAADHASLSFAPKVGFAPMLSGNIRHLTVPMQDVRMAALRAEFAGEGDADHYRILTFEAPWPSDSLHDQCALFPCMSTDEPHGDEGHEEEIWDAARVARERRPPGRPRRRLPDCGGAARRLGPTRRLHRALHRCRVSGTGLPDADGRLTRAPGPPPGIAIKLANLDQLANTVPDV